MSDRKQYPDVKSSVVKGDVISLFRDNDTRTYRLFVSKEWKEIPPNKFSFDRCECCDLSLEDLRQLSARIDEIVLAHEEWRPLEDD
jgi:hypothetical protein